MARTLFSRAHRGPTLHRAAAAAVIFSLIQPGVACSGRRSEPSGFLFQGGKHFNLWLEKSSISFLHDSVKFRERQKKKPLRNMLMRPV